MSNINNAADATKKTAEDVKGDFNKTKKDVSKKASEATEKKGNRGDEFKKEVDDLEKEGKTYFNKLVAFIKEKSSCASKVFSANFKEGQKKTSAALAKTSEEFQNPVVIAQALVGVTGVFAGYLTYLERHRIDTDNKLVLGIHGSIITGLVLLDGFLFRKYYPKFDKKYP
ncbi:uncharacterized protein PRCAT00005542001 [Priceomyces carsonii]|uniref:uncharacterized protein n=1 Tax=Priceomyces carsonii TaxID=28549 RepID=UPI002ED77576|nr:unnamed protein product [Priceomyces carsonii]